MYTHSPLSSLFPLGHSKGASKPQPVSKVQLPLVSSPTPVIASVVTPSLPPIPPPAALSPGNGRERRKRKSMTTRAQTKVERNVSHLMLNLLPSKYMYIHFCLHNLSLIVFLLQ